MGFINSGSFHITTYDYDDEWRINVFPLDAEQYIVFSETDEGGIIWRIHSLADSNVLEQGSLPFYTWLIYGAGKDYGTFFMMDGNSGDTILYNILTNQYASMSALPQYFGAKGALFGGNLLGVDEDNEEAILWRHGNTVEPLGVHLQVIAPVGIVGVFQALDSVWAFNFADVGDHNYVHFFGAINQSLSEFLDGFYDINFDSILYVGAAAEGGLIVVHKRFYEHVSQAIVAHITADGDVISPYSGVTPIAGIGRVFMSDFGSIFANPSWSNDGTVLFNKVRSYHNGYSIIQVDWMQFAAPSSFVKKFQNSLSTLFAGSISATGDLDGPILDARVNSVVEIAALSAGAQRAPLIPETNRYYVLDSNKIKLIHPCDEDIDPSSPPSVSSSIVIYGVTVEPGTAGIAAIEFTAETPVMVLVNIIWSGEGLSDLPPFWFVDGTQITSPSGGNVVSTIVSLEPGEHIVEATIGYWPSPIAADITLTVIPTNSTQNTCLSYAYPE